MGLRDEVALYERLTGEDANNITIERLGGFCDGYHCAQEEIKKYKWHNLRENPEDIPLNNNLVLILLEGNVYDLTRVTSLYWLKHEDKIIAWKEIGLSEVEE